MSRNSPPPRYNNSSHERRKFKKKELLNFKKKKQQCSFLQKETKDMVRKKATVLCPPCAAWSKEK